MKCLRKIHPSNKILIAVLLIFTKSNKCQAFTLPIDRRHTTTHNYNQYSLKRNVFYAKPPPISQFNLEDIEAAEKEFDRQPLLSISGDILDDDIDDDVEDGWRLETNTPNTKVFTVPPELKNQRIDAIISALEPDMSRSQCGSLVSEGMVAIITDGDSSPNQQAEVITRKSTKLKEGTVLHVKQEIVNNNRQLNDIISQELPLDILYEDEHMIVLNKAAGMVVHPAAGNWDGTVVNALAYYLANNSPFGSGEFIDEDGKVKAENGEGIDVDGTDGETITFRPGIVHRLDKGTTGVLVVAKTRMALGALSEAFANRTVKKTYAAITVGNPGKRVVIDKPIGRHPLHRQKMRVVPDPSKKNSSRMTPNEKRAMNGGLGGRTGMSTAQIGRRALSFVDTLAFDGKLSIVQVRIETGRTHQIRVHLQDRSTPIYGDDIYGLPDWNKRLNKTHKIERPLLHAFRLELDHPISGEKMVIRAPMPEDMARVATAIWPDGQFERGDLFEASGVE